MGAGKRHARRVALAAAVALGGAVAAAGSVPLSPVLNRLEPGLWQVRKLDSPGEPPILVCLGNPGTLLQLEHRQAPCQQQLIDSEASGLTVNYTCPGTSFGQTHVRIETPRLAKVDSQGIEGNVPFSFRGEARRLGACAIRAGR